MGFLTLEHDQIVEQAEVAIDELELDWCDDFVLCNVDPAAARWHASWCIEADAFNGLTPSRFVLFEIADHYTDNGAVSHLVECAFAGRLRASLRRLRRKDLVELHPGPHRYMDRNLCVAGLWGLTQRGDEDLALLSG